jgi:hypothetical protein
MANSPYILDALLLSGFRAYLTPKAFDFSVKRCLAVFAPNGSGKSSIIDALEFIFSEDGTLERLGVRAINNQAGFAALAHNLAEEKKINSKVGVAFKEGSKKHEGSRNASGRERPRPPIGDAISACFTVSPIIRGHALRAFVEEQKAEKRYEDVAHWLQLGPLVDVQRHLRELRRATKAAAEDRTPHKRVDVQLAKSSANAVKEWDDKAVLAYANSVLAPLDAALSLKALEATDSALVKVRDRAKVEEKQLGLEGLRQIRRTATALYKEAEGPGGALLISGLLPEFAAAIDLCATAAAAEDAERAAAANATFAALWKVAEPLFADGKPELKICPICATTISKTAAGSVEGVRKHIAEHLAELADYAKAKKALDDAKSNVSKLHGQLIAALISLPPLLAKEHSGLEAALASHLVAVESWENGAPPDANTLQISLRDLTAALDATIATIESKQGENTYVKVLSKLERLVELKEERELADGILAEIGKLSTALNAQAAYISGEIRKKVQSLLNTLQTPINDIYRGIQGKNAAPIRLDLPSEDETNQQRLNLVVDFSVNREGVLACTRFRRHRVRCFNGTGGGSWRGGSLHASSSLRLCG